jgi:hypothetical protein
MFSPRKRLALYLFAMVLTVGFISALIIWNFLFAWSKDNGNFYRLRSYVVAKTNIVQGVQLTEEYIERRLGRLRVDTRFIPNPTMPVGKYALKDIDKGYILTADLLSESPPADVTVGGAVVPVEVKSKHAVSLKPRMLLALVKNKTKLPSVELCSGKNEPCGFLLLSMTTSSGNPAITVLMIAVPKDMLSCVAELATGEWNPVILGASVH